MAGTTLTHSLSLMYVITKREEKKVMFLLVSNSFGNFKLCKSSFALVTHCLAGLQVISFNEKACKPVCV